MSYLNYLLESKVVNQEKMLDVLCYQVDHMPSFLTTLRSTGKLDETKIVSLINKQIATGMPVAILSIQEKMLTEADVLEIKKIQQVKMPSTIEVIVKLNILNFKDADEHMQKYVSTLENGKLDSSLKFEMPRLAETKKVEVVDTTSSISSAALESMRELGMDVSGMNVSVAPVETVVQSKELNSMFLEEFESSFSDKQIMKLQKIIQFIVNAAKDKSDVSNVLNSWYKEILMIKGLLNLIEAKKMESLVERIVVSIEKKFKLDNDHLIEWVMTKGESELNEVLSFLVESRDVLIKTKSEAGAVNEKYNKIIKILE